ncbi:hypothetical protein TrVE_jg12752 [Triparma verrucosa]|uniref:Uncharacterized protein n=1 Tax=Triparma verrucosa TaxID=1606542 RepID=A0A9W7C0K9_9STRA|nr:hypothetical protein TrVE_jg12752 [Triparma verrucosa]
MLALVECVHGKLPFLYVKGGRMNYTDLLNSLLSTLHPACYHILLHENNNLIPNDNGTFWWATTDSGNANMHSASLTLRNLGTFFGHAFTKNKIILEKSYWIHLRSSCSLWKTFFLTALLFDREVSDEMKGLSDEDDEDGKDDKDDEEMKELSDEMKRLISNVISAINDAENTALEDGGLTVFDTGEKTKLSAEIFKQRVEFVGYLDKMTSEKRLSLGITDEKLEPIQSAIRRGVNYYNCTQWKPLLCQCVSMFEEFVGIEGLSSLDWDNSKLVGLRLIGDLAKYALGDDNDSCDCEEMGNKSVGSEGMNPIMKHASELTTLVNGGLSLVCSGGCSGRLLFCTKEEGTVMVNSTAVQNLLVEINMLMDVRRLRCVSLKMILN